MKKIKILWFALVPLAWFIAFKLVVWAQAYADSIACDSERGPFGVCSFLFITGVFGTVTLIIGSAVLAAYLQD